MYKRNPYQPIRGIVDLILDIGFKREVRIAVVSVGSGEVNGEVSTRVELLIAGLPFEADLAGTWKDRDARLAELIEDFIDDYRDASPKQTEPFEVLCKL